MDWIGTDQFKSDFAAASDASDGQIEMALEAAEDELIELVGQSAVTDALSETPTDTTRAARLVRGHKFLAFSIFLWNDSNVKRYQDESSPATQAVTTIEHWDAKNIEIKSDKWRSMALRAIGSYLIADVEGDDYSPAVEYSHPVIADFCNPYSC